MAFVPVRLSQRLTLGCVVLLILTALAVFAVMALRGQPRVVAASGELIEQTGSAIVRQLALQLARIEGVTASLAHLAEVLPREEPLYLNSLPNLIDSQGDKAIAGGASEITGYFDVEVPADITLVHKPFSNATLQAALSRAWAQ